jgi:hypothetical protein
MENFENAENKPLGYVFKRDSGSGRPTMVLKLKEEAWDLVKHLFDEDGRPNNQEVKRISYRGYVWDLYAYSYTSNRKSMFKIYGVSGDWTFGNAPTYYQQRHRGNIRAAKEIFSSFISKYLG